MDSNIIARKWIQGMTVKPDSLLGQAFTGEEGAHVFRITGETTGGAAVPITGTIAAKFLRSDNITVPLSGSISDGVAVVTLTDECYLVPGRFIFSIYVIQGDLRMCIYCGVGNVFRTDSGEYEGGQIITDITELINEIQEAVESIPPDYSELTGEVADLKSAVFEYGKPSEIEWALGTFGSTGNYNSYKNVVRTNNAIVAKKGDVISCDSGYIIRVWLYNAASSDPLSDSFISGSRSDWVTSYTVPQNCYLRMVIGDTTNYTNNQYVLTDTSYSQHVVWNGFLLSSIRDDVTALQSDMQNAESEIIQKMAGGYVDISELLNNDGGILQGAVGDVISFYPQYAQAYKSIAFPVNIGEKVRVSGEASADYRLWMFTDTDRKVLQKSATFLTEQNLEITAQQNGYVVFNAIRTGAYTPKIEIWADNMAQYINAETQKNAFENISCNHGVLSAFSNIVCCGDSITTSVVYTGETWSGGQVEYTARSAYRKWTQILADRTGANVSYLATGGFTPVNWWNTYAGSISGADNQLAIVYLGTNGALTDTIDADAPGDDVSNYDKTTNTGAYCSIVKSWLDVGARVLLIHVKKGDDLYTTNAVIDKIGTKFGAAVVEVPGLWDNKYHSYPDGSGANTVHYNDLGYAAFAETLMAAVGALDETMFLRLCPR